jgi:hypothetical protein
LRRERASVLMSAPPLAGSEARDGTAQILSLSMSAAGIRR